MPILYKISAANLCDLLERLSHRAKVFVPYKRGEKLTLEPFDAARADSIELGEVRQSQPIKTFLNHPRKEISEDEDNNGKVVIAGIKACDLASLKLQDFVFAEGVTPDPFYVNNRSSLTIISCDCNLALETCFCVAMDGAPCPAGGFDLNLSVIGEDYLVEVGSEKGGDIITEFKAFFSDADRRDIESRDALRRKVRSAVEDFIARTGTPSVKDIAGAVMRNYSSQIWKDFYATCVECGACNFACPTCHCFLLFDEGRNGKRRGRFMEWDACLYNRFARVAGGADPRKYLWERLRNRFEKKFDFFPKVMGSNACTGCGRCIEACPGDIDIREVLKGLVRGEWSKPPNE